MKRISQLIGFVLVLFVAMATMPELREVDVWGYINYDEAWEIGKPAHYSPEDTRLIHRSLLTLDRLSV